MASLRTKNGKWQARIKRGAIVVEKSFLNKRDADRWARLIEAEIERGQYQPPCPAQAQEAPETVSDLLTRYEREVAPQHRSGTSKFNIRVLKRTLGETALAALDAQATAQWRDKQLKCIKPPTVARQMNTLSAILNHARKEWCYQIANPVPDIKRPSQGQARSRRFAAGEEMRLMRELDQKYAQVARFALATAMRRGEILALTWNNIDWIRRVAFLPTTKNGEARRVPLSTTAIRILDAIRQSPVMPISGIIFDVHPLALDRGWRRACRRAELLDFRFHDLRHEAVSRLFEQGLNVIEVASISGHKTLAMLKRYTHLRAEDLALKLG